MALGAVIVAAVTALVAPFLAPWRRKAERAGIVVAGEDPVDVLAETDPAIIWAGNPPWVGFRYYFADELPSNAPPAVGFDWSKWAYKHGGVDVALTIVQITIQARFEAAVVLDAPIIRVDGRSKIAGGVIAACPAGGADLTPRRFEVDLEWNPPLVDYMDQDQKAVPNPAFKLGAGDVERFHIWVRAHSDDLVEWTLELPVIVNGKRVTLPINGPVDFSFRTAGSEVPASEWYRSGDQWVPQNPDQSD